MDPDEALTYLGKRNKWQIRSYFVFGTAFGLAFSWMRLAIIFIGDAPNYHCALPDNATLDEWLPLKDDGKYEQCRQYTNHSVDNTTTGCLEGYWYDPASGYDETIATEWDLVCDDAWLVELAMMLINLGSCLGALIFTRLSDGLGRRPVFLFCLGVDILVILIQSLSPNMAFFSFMSVMDGVFQTGIFTTSTIMALELFPTYRRSFVGISMEFFWAGGYVSLTLLAYFIRHWRYLQMTICALLSPMVIFYWLAPESIPWLVANGREEEAERLLRAALEGSGQVAPDRIFTDNPTSNNSVVASAAKAFNLAVTKGKETADLAVLKPAVTKPGNETSNSEPTVTDPSKEALNPDLNGKTDPSSATDQVDGSSTELKGSRPTVLSILRDTFTCQRKAVGSRDDNYGPRDILRHPKLRKYALVLLVVWFVNGLTYYALTFSVSYVPGDRYVNNAFYGLLEAPAYLLAWLLVFKVGRRIPLCVCHIVAGVALLGSILQRFEFSVDLTVLHIILNQIGKFGITITFAIVILYTPELFPTNIRSTGYGFSIVAAKSGQVIAPFLRTLHRAYPMVPPLLIGAASLLVGFLALLLPETRYDALPETMGDVDRLGRGRKRGQRGSDVGERVRTEGGRARQYMYEQVQGTAGRESGRLDSVGV